MQVPVIFVLAVFGLCSSEALASPIAVATVARLEGVCSVYVNRSAQPSGPSPRVFYQGSYYTETVGKIGDRVGIGDIIQTQAKSKLRLIYKNGDQIVVGPTSSYRVVWRNPDEEQGSLLELFFGRIRATIVKSSPRSGLQVQTAAAAMGVRGTDFFVSTFGAKGGTELSVFRGSVAFAPKEVNAPAEAPKPVVVTQGYSIAVLAPVVAKDAAKVLPPPLVPEKITQEKLVVLQKETVVAKPPENLASAAPELLKEVQELEKEAVRTTLQDIKEHDPELYQAVLTNKKPVESIETIQVMAVKKLLKEAPPEEIEKSSTKPAPVKAKKKVLDEDLDRLLQEDVYDKYQ